MRIELTTPGLRDQCYKDVLDQRKVKTAQCESDMHLYN